MEITLHKKTSVMTGRINLKVFPEIIDKVDIEASRLRREGLRFGERKAKSAVVIMAAIEEFLMLPEDIRNKLYLKRIAEYERRLAEPVTRTFDPLPSPPSTT
jgi:hypothetical protein